MNDQTIKARLTASHLSIASEELQSYARRGGQPAVSRHIIGHQIDALIASIELVDPQFDAFEALHMALRHEQARFT